MDYLMRDRMTNIDMLEILEIPAASVLLANGGGALVAYDDLFLLSAEPENEAEFLRCLTDRLVPGRETLVVLRSDSARTVLTRDYGFQTVMECCHAVYSSKEPISYSLPAGAEIRKLDPRYADFVHAHYHMVDDADYIRSRIEAGMFGVFWQGEIVGFAGTHEERPMGMLEILPQYRRLGLAYCLEAYLINHLLAQGRIAFCQVAVNNEASKRLQQKLGLELSGRVIYWLALGRMK